jgi:hypothetical protein
MRATFELKIVAKTLEEAKQLASKKVAEFMQISEVDLEKYINLELKVSYEEAKSSDDIEKIMLNDKFIVTVYGSVKQSVTGAFGF